MPMIRNTYALNTRALVTGGAGFLGSHLCERLIKEQLTSSALDVSDIEFSISQRLPVKPGV
jgi:nucleoside-diphosphate-sugar epimerase